MMNSRSGETICAFLNPCRRRGDGMWAGFEEMVIKEGATLKMGEKREGKSWEKNKFTSFIHHPLAWYHCLTMATKEIKNTGISMWKAPGLWLCVQKAKELWFRGIFNLHSHSNKGLAVALRAVVQPDWGSGGEEWGRRGDRQDHRPHLFPLFTLARLCSHWRAAFPLSLSSPPPHLAPLPPFALRVVNVRPEE